ncbi:hypothetical protein EDC01DRAFT_270816 [Geopyxis carbonaria]|nr:hypothetical protein EDC01DRAFT_270816 [Geopyxis carbonaria]
MSTPPLSLPFSHWTTAASHPPTSPVTASRLQAQTLITGHTSGELCVFSLPDRDGGEMQMRARLHGHTAAIIAILPMASSVPVPPTATAASSAAAATPPSTSPDEFLSLSADAALSKYSLADFRCVQATQLPFPRPQGMTLSACQQRIFVWGSTCDILVVHAASLEVVLVWDGHVDWPLPLPVAGVGLYTVRVSGEVTEWEMKRVSGDAKRVLEVERRGARGSVEANGEWGSIKEVRAVEGGVVVVQRGGVTLHSIGESFEAKAKMETKSGVVAVTVTEDGGTVGVQSGAGKLILLSAKQLEEVGDIDLTVLAEGAVQDIALHFSTASGKGNLVLSTRAGITLAALSTSDKRISASHSTTLVPAPSDVSPAASTCSEIFEKQLAIANGSSIHIHVLPTFLLTPSLPSRTISLPCAPSPICLLKRVRIGEYIGPGRGAAVVRGGREYLIAGTSSGCIYILTSASPPSPRLPLFPGAVRTAHLLPSNLGRRICSTLLLSSGDGTAALVDVERARTMLTFPSHDSSPIASFATRTGKNLLALTYADGVRREWDMGEQDGGVLRNPSPPSRSGEDKAPERLDAGWRVVDLTAMEPENREDEGEEEDDGSLKIVESFSQVGLPVAVVDLRIVLAALEKGGKRLEKQTAKALLVALCGRPEVLFPQLQDKEMDEDSRTAMASFTHYFPPASPSASQTAVMGQIGAGGRVTMFTPSIDKLSLSPTVASIVLLIELVLICGLLQSEGKSDATNLVLEKVLQAHLAAGSKMSLGLFAKFWSDGDMLIRWIARECLEAFMSDLSSVERAALVESWYGFLPVHVPPEVAATKEVARSVILLSKLITDYPTDDSMPDSLKKAVAMSAALLLAEPDPLYQDTAIETLGYSWSIFQTHLDPLTTLHALIHHSTTSLSPARQGTLHRTLVLIASANSLLLSTAFATSISPTPLPSASLPAEQLQSLAAISTSALRLVASLIPELADGVPVLVDAVVRILDPNNGLREKVLPAVTELVEAMVTAYPTLAFHRPSQRLALSTNMMKINIYDLRSATTAHELRGHKETARMLVFSGDGKYIAGVAGSPEKEELLVWRFVGGLLSFIGTATTGESDKTLQPRARWPLKVGVPIQVEWVGERKIKLLGEDGMVEFAV